MASENLPEELNGMIDGFYEMGFDLNCVEDQTRQFRDQIKELISQAYTKGNLNLNDWTKQTIPFFNREVDRVVLYCEMTEDEKSKISGRYNFNLDLLNENQKKWVLKNGYTRPLRSTMVKREPLDDKFVLRESSGSGSGHSVIEDSQENISDVIILNGSQTAAVPVSHAFRAPSNQPNHEVVGEGSQKIQFTSTPLQSQSQSQSQSSQSQPSQSQQFQQQRVPYNNDPQDLMAQKLFPRATKYNYASPSQYQPQILLSEQRAQYPSSRGLQPSPVQTQNSSQIAQKPIQSSFNSQGQSQGQIKFPARPQSQIPVEYSTTSSNLEGSQHFNASVPRSSSLTLAERVSNSPGPTTTPIVVPDSTPVHTPSPKVPRANIPEEGMQNNGRERTPQSDINERNNNQTSLERTPMSVTDTYRPLKRSFFESQPIEVFKRARFERREFAHMSPVIGYSKTLEKKFKPFEQIPRGNEVRSKDVLKILFAQLERKANNPNYLATNYVEEQLKGMEQDLYVQNIEDVFAIKVYETHLKFMIRNKTFANYGSMSSHLIHFYLQYIEDGYNASYTLNRNIFVSLHCLVLIIAEKRGELATFLQYIKVFLEFNSKSKPPPKTANYGETLFTYILKLSSYYVNYNYHEFLKLCQVIIKKKGFTELAEWSLFTQLFDLFRNRERIVALGLVCVYYKSLMLDVILYELRFDSEEECVAFIKDLNIEKEVSVSETIELDCSSVKPILNSERAALRKSINSFFA